MGKARPDKLREDEVKRAKGGRRTKIELFAHDGLGERGAPGVKRVDHNDGCVELTVESRHIGYITRFVRRRCAPDLLAQGLYPNAKEISESEGMRAACVERLGYDRRDPGICAVVVGDGATPRTGALFAYTTAWQIISIDPALASWTAPKGAIRRLTTIGEKIEEARPISRENAHAWVLVAPHSHAKLENALAWVRASAEQAQTIAIAACACCVEQTLSATHCDERYRDLGIWSDRGTLQIWRETTEEGKQ